MLLCVEGADRAVPVQLCHLKNIVDKCCLLPNGPGADLTIGTDGPNIRKVDWGHAAGESLPDVWGGGGTVVVVVHG